MNSFFICLLLLTSPQKPLPPWTGKTNQEILAITLISEAGWTSEKDWAAMSWVMHRTSSAKKNKVISKAKRFATIWRRKKIRGRTKWLRVITSKCEYPVYGDKENPPFSLKMWNHAYREHCLAAMRFAKTFLEDRYKVEDPCAPHKPINFGGRMDNPPKSHERVDCGTTKQRYYTKRAKQ